MNKPIYQLICENIKDGQLDSSFDLPSEDADDIRWAAGAKDGVYIYHVGHRPLDDNQLNGLIECVKAASQYGDKIAEPLFHHWTKENSAITAVDQLLGYIVDNQNELDPNNLFATAIAMVTESVHIECVKIGLELLELFDTSGEKTREIIRTVGLCDEFTIFAVWSMRHWDNGNDEIFELAKKVHGWGRIHAIEFLEPDNEEIKHWLLTDGVHNDVMPAYSALTCWRKAQAEKILFGEHTEEQYRGLSGIIDGLMEEGPCSGISELENAETVLLRFLEMSEKYALKEEDYSLFRTIKHWAEDENEGNSEAVARMCRSLLNGI